MPGGSNGVILRRIDQIFGGHAVAGLAEGQLLDRYLAHRDEAAFEALVDRHGPMVMGVCRRLLRDEHAVEDVFQAVFLVLVRRAGQIRERHLIGPWLHAVATRTAVRARANAQRRRAIEGAESLSDPADDESDPASKVDLGELRSILDEEVGRLPEKYRRPVVLCYFQGKTHDEAAAMLRWPVGTVRGRLSRARDRLRDRLSRRGLALGAGLTSFHVFQQSTPAALPPSLVAVTVRGALAFAVGKAGPGLISASASALGEDILRTMLMTKWKLLSATALTALGLAATGAVVNAVQQPTPEPGFIPAVSSAIPGDAPQPVAPADLAQADSVPSPAVPPAVPASQPPPVPGAPPGFIGNPSPLQSPSPAHEPSFDAGPLGRPTPNPAALPPAPPGQGYRRVTITAEDGSPMTAYILTPTETLPTPRHLPQPQPNVPPPSEEPRPVSEVSPPVQPPMPVPSDVSLRGELPPPDGLIGDPAAIRTYLERTKNEVGQAIDRLSNEEEQLTSRLRGISEDLQRLRAIQQVLERGMDAESATLIPEAVPTLKPDQAVDISASRHEGAVNVDAVPELAPFASQEAVQSAVSPGQGDFQPTGLISPADPNSTPTPMLDGTAPSQEQRLRDVESKLDRLLEAIESLKGELQTIKGDGETPRTFPS